LITRDRVESPADQTRLNVSEGSGMLSGSNWITSVLTSSVDELKGTGTKAPRPTSVRKVLLGCGGLNRTVSEATDSRTFTPVSVSVTPSVISNVIVGSTGGAKHITMVSTGSKIQSSGPRGSNIPSVPVNPWGVVKILPKLDRRVGSDRAISRTLARASLAVDHHSPATENVCPTVFRRTSATVFAGQSEPSGTSR
jgi:hypothetical protein